MTTRPISGKVEPRIEISATVSEAVAEAFEDTKALQKGAQRCSRET